MSIHFARRNRRRVFATAAATLAGCLVAICAQASPVITSVKGCSDDGAGATAQCHAAGGDVITIVGQSFGSAGAAPQAFVGGHDCPVTQADDTTVECTLPPGAGSNVDLVVTDSTGLSSFPQRLLSYSPPSITSVQGCTDDLGGNTSECARAGGDHITIHGDNFGPSGATALIGGRLCPSTSSDDSSIVCTLPPGSGTAKRVLVVTANQLSVGVSYTLSYAQCPAGTTLTGGGQCSACSAGTFSSTLDAPTCDTCPAGTVSADSASSCSGTSVVQCWQAKDVSDTKFTPVLGQAISDDIAPSGTVDLKKVAMYCTAASLSATGVPPPDVHQCCYQAKGTKLSVPVALATDDQDASRSIDVSQPKMVCVQCTSNHL